MDGDGGEKGYLFWIKVHRVAGHVLCQAKDLHLLADGSLDDFLEGVLSMARAELARVAMMREWHRVCIFCWVVVSQSSSSYEVHGRWGMVRQ